MKGPRTMIVWRESARGGFWYRHGNYTLTVFERPKGSGHWTYKIEEGGKTRFAKGSYATDLDAMTAVANDAFGR
jgi:hypothetical protein